MGRKPCCSKEEVNRGAWSFQEDQILTSYINAHGEGQWRALPQKAGLNRCGKSCRLRWLNYLRPEIKRGNISKDEEDLIIRLHTLLGNRWSLIAGRIPGRTDNEIKNYWNTNLSKRLLGQNSPSNSVQKRSKTLEKRKGNNDQVPNNNSHLIRTRAYRHTNLKPLINQDLQSDQYIAANNMACISNEEINCNNSSIVHDHGQCSSNNTNTKTTSSPTLAAELEAGGINDPLGFLMDFDTRNINIVDFEDDHFPRAEAEINDQPLKMNDDDPSKNIRSLPSSDLLIDANGIEIRTVETEGEKQEMKFQPNMEINLMLELEKIASFLDMEDEWINNM